MIQCEIWTGTFTGVGKSINHFFEENPQFRYVGHSAHVREEIELGGIDIVVFYETNPHSVIRSGPHTGKQTTGNFESHEPY